MHGVVPRARHHSWYAARTIHRVAVLVGGARMHDASAVCPPGLALRQKETEALVTGTGPNEALWYTGHRV